MKCIHLFSLMVLLYPGLIAFGQETAEPEETPELQSETLEAAYKRPDPLKKAADLKNVDIIALSGNYSYVRQESNTWYWGDYYQTTSILGLEGSWSRFVIEKIALGCAVSHYRYTYKYSYNSYSTTNSYSMVGPRLGFYYGKTSSKAIPFIEAEYDIYTGVGNNFKAAKVGVGAIFQIKPQIGVSAKVDYLNYLPPIKGNTTILGSLGIVGFLY